MNVREKANGFGLCASACAAPAASASAASRARIIADDGEKHAGELLVTRYRPLENHILKVNRLLLDAECGRRSDAERAAICLVICRRDRDTLAESELGEALVYRTLEIFEIGSLSDEADDHGAFRYCYENATRIFPCLRIRISTPPLSADPARDVPPRSRFLWLPLP